MGSFQTTSSELFASPQQRICKPRLAPVLKEEKHVKRATSASSSSAKKLRMCQEDTSILTISDPGQTLFQPLHLCEPKQRLECGGSSFVRRKDVHRRPVQTAVADAQAAPTSAAARSKAAVESPPTTIRLPGHRHQKVAGVGGVMRCKKRRW